MAKTLLTVKNEYENYNLSKIIRKRPSPVTKICKCGNETNDKDGICVICKLNLNARIKELRWV